MTLDRKEQEQHEADELASEAFDRYLPEIEQWVRDAFVGEWGLSAENSAKQILWVAITQAHGPGDALLFRLRHAVEQLRDVYIDHASTQGLYAATAEDNVNSAISDEAERLRDLADDRQVDAYQSGLRG